MALTDKFEAVKILDSLYDNVLLGLPGTDSAEEMAQDYVNKNASIEHAIDSLIRWQIAKAGTTGFLTGLGGLITLPVVLPANLTGNLYIQMRMIAAIAHICGYDIKSDQVRTLIYACMAGDATKDILKQAGIEIGKKLTNAAIRKISFEAIKRINKAVGFRLVTKFGKTGAVNLGRAVPFVGGFVGASADSFYCYKVGCAAKGLFLLEGSSGVTNKAA